ncbi:MAG: class I SAM-dependent methyltransferase [Syntrophales bacterium]|nr:class I SAM-dependent methyltransferase [Syntrophales bacterium]
MYDTELIRTFEDINTHKRIGELIRKHSTNPRSIHSYALEGLDLSSFKRIIDLGCASGTFTEALKDRIPPDAQVLGVDIIPSYKEPFLETCARVGVRGDFYGGGVSILASLPESTFDLILCSYALYYFPDAIYQLSRILNKKGLLVAITHFRNNTSELAEVIKKVLRRKGTSSQNQLLPLEEVIGRFCAENGLKCLKPFFRRTTVKNFRNKLIFTGEDAEELVEYIRFKAPFFISNAELEETQILNELINWVHLQTRKKRIITITKDDRIFISSEPISRCQK